jgi:glycopeptide antibiotics resistance protein
MHFFSIPFSSLYRGTEFNALTEITRKSLLFGVLGVLWVGLIQNLAATRRSRRIWHALAWLYAVALSTAIEAVQAVFPPHVTDVTDVLIAAAGMAAGLYVGSQVFGPPKDSGGRPGLSRQQ